VTAPSSARRPKVVILGGGFGGVYAARQLARAPVDIVLVDRTNHFVFQPLLYQVATALLAETDIAVPIRWRLRKQRNTVVALAEATTVDVERRTVALDRAPHELSYDYLVVATGARHAYFGHDEWETRAPGLKSLADALEIRQRFLLAFERAEWEANEAERQALLTFVVVGGGPTGVELAGMIPDASRHTFRKEYRNIDSRQARVILLEGGPRLLPSFPDSLSVAAKRQLEDLRVEVQLGALVTSVDSHGVLVTRSGDGASPGPERIEARSVFWAAGNAASPLGNLIGGPVDRAGRVLVEGDLSVPGHREIFVVGDLASVTEDGRPVPAVAPAAMQQGRCAGRNIRHDLNGEPRERFHYVNKGELATIGRHKAVASFAHGKIRFSGYFAWWTWLLVHIMYLAGFRNRAIVLLQWGFAYFTYQRGARIIPEPDRQ
jgi:NADH dehydrogenase